MLEPGRELPIVDRFFHDEAGIRRFVSNFENRVQLRTCYEAGPTGYELERLLQHLSVACEVIAPSLVLDRVSARHRLSKFLLRHGGVFRSANQWTVAHEVWLRQRSFSDPALALTFSHYRAVLDSLEAHLRVVEDDLVPYFCDGPFAEAVGRLSTYRGVTEMGALVLSAEVCDWRRFSRATTLMGSCGLVPSEYSSEERTSRGRNTKAGNTHLRVQLVESAWPYQHRPAVGPLMNKRRSNRCATLTSSHRSSAGVCASLPRGR